MSRRGALAAWVLAVLLAHLLLGDWMAGRFAVLQGAGAERGLRRLQADFVAELIPAAAPRAPPRVAPRPAPRRTAAAPPAPPASAASAPEPPLAVPALLAADELGPASQPQAAEAAPPPVVEEQAPPLVAEAAAPPLVAEAPALDAPALAASAAAAEPEAAATAFEWPRSTRLDYRLTGNYRGPVDGQASVQWLLQGTHYQVHVEVSVGPSFAPLLSRRMSSDGVIGATGLSPRRYEEETRVALRSPRRLQVELGPDRVRLPNGSELPRPPGVQDSASQFVQLTWLFTTQPQRLRGGESIPIMLALPRRVDPWVYDVLAQETLLTPAGAFEVMPVRPRRPERPRGDLSAEVWLAPSLQYLPVRILIRQDQETWVDLLLVRLPRQTAAASSAPAASAASQAR